MSGKKQNHYQQYLEKLHQQKQTPREVIDDLVKQTTGQRGVNYSKILAGEANEVYDVELENRQHVIVRISNGEKNPFLKEAWGIEQCSLKGIPVPQFLLIKSVETEQGMIHVCLQEKLPGDTLERGKIDMQTMDVNLLKRLMHQAGEYLCDMHTIAVKGVGTLNELGQGEYDTFDDLMKHLRESEKEFLDVAQKYHYPEQKIYQAYDVLINNLSYLQTSNPVFNHGDFSPKHIMVDRDRVTGILDFGEVQGHHPLFDLVRWDYWHGHSDALTWVWEGYGETHLGKDELKEISKFIKIQIGLETMWWYEEQEYPQGVKSAIRRIDQALEV